MTIITAAVSNSVPRSCSARFDLSTHTLITDSSALSWVVCLIPSGRWRVRSRRQAETDRV